LIKSTTIKERKGVFLLDKSKMYSLIYLPQIDAVKEIRTTNANTYSIELSKLLIKVC